MHSTTQPYVLVATLVMALTLVARDSEGKEVGHLAVRGGGDVPPSPGQPKQGPARS